MQLISQTMMRQLTSRMALAATLIVAAWSQPAISAPVGISNIPLINTRVTVKPNLMFILDNSGSMARNFMPDELGNGDNGYTGKYGFWSSQCNGTAFNPNEPYTPPVRADGTSYPNAAFGAAYTDGYDTTSSTANLANRYYYIYTPTTNSPAPMSWTYSSSGAVDTSTTFYSECMSDIGSAPGSARFTQVIVTSTSAEAQKYANWFSYYRTRRLLMRTATGLAFNGLSSDYRVGFTAISDTGITGSMFLDVADFDATQRSDFYTKLYSTTGSGYTPLRASLSKVGRYFANAISGQTYDPIEYSCQRNFALLSTDGYWNNNAETGSYRAYRLDGSTMVGQQDGLELRPMYDGANVVSTTVTPTTTVVRRDTVTQRSTPTTYTRYRWVTGTSRTGAIQVTRQTRTITVVQDTTVTTDTTTTSTRTVVTTNGAVTSDQTTTNNSVANVGSPVVTLVSTTDSGWVNGSTSSKTLSSSTQFNTAGLQLSSTMYANSCNSSTGNTTIGAGGCGFTTSSSAVAGTSAVGTASVISGPTATVVSTTGPTVGIATTTVTSTGGSSNSLADVAAYYYNTDLRSTMANNVRATATDPATHQHLTTFTVGLGVRGTLAYDRNYLTQTTGDYARIRGIATPTLNWPIPSAGDDATHIDDLWHAAVNGRGQYFSATDPATLSDAIETTLRRVTEASGAGAAAAASTLTPVSGDDWIFLPTYSNAPTWNGDIRAFRFTFSATGEIISPDTSEGRELWSARSVLESRTTARRILFNSGGSLGDFTYANLTTAGLASSFDNRCTTAVPNLSQCGTLTTAARAKVTGDNLVRFLAGDKSLYLNAADIDNRAFRSRAYLLGDFMNGSPVYSGKPPFRYADAGYSAFVEAKKNRTKVVFAPANDGMLHAFKVATDGTGGTELWAYVPTGVIPDLWHLADDAYEANHRYYVDGSVNVSDVFDGTNWRTILIGGLGGGGRSYYALDVTDPENPSLLWEFTDDNLGLTYGNAIVAKLPTAISTTPQGTWVVAFTSGYNNGTVGDGRGRLYVRNALTGAEVITLNTGAGSAATPSNLGKINAWTESATNNTALRFYGGDMLGNLWRFDYADQVVPAGSEAFLLARAINADNAVQPITTKPILYELTNGGTRTAVVAFGTGRYLGSDDLTNTDVQSIYAIKDSLTATGLGNLHSAGAGLVRQTLNASRLVASPATVDWTASNGWYVDLDQSSKERVNVDGTPLAVGVIGFASTVPTGDACDQGGRSYLYQFNMTTGNVVKVDSYNALIVGIGRVVSINGTVSGTVTKQDRTFETSESPRISGGPSSGNVKRTSWRELVD